MPSESVVDIDELLAPIEGEDEAGQSVPFLVREQLEEERKEVNPDEWDDDDPTKPTEPKYANWPKIEQLARETLINTSKDLLVAARLTEALTREHGFVGLADGLHLLRRMLEECWERMYPSIEDGDLEVRAGPFNWLGDPDRGARFPYTVRTVPIVGGQHGYSWQDWRETQGSGGRVSQEDFEKAIRNSPREQCQLVVEDLGRCSEELEALDQTLNEKLGSDAPAMTEIRRALAECRTLAQQILDKKEPEWTEEEGAEEGEEGAEGEGGAVDDGRGGGVARAMRSRADAYQRLAEAADFLAQLEPHSPIPFLVRRAVELGNMPFPQLMRALIRDEAVLGEMNRELGIKEESEEEEY